jgi:3-hydroxyisobutyrate dehydrogenase-like beta-hydroxyacid dehydrogenase
VSPQRDSANPRAYASTTESGAAVAPSYPAVAPDASRSHFEFARPALDSATHTFAAETIHVGSCGSGAKMKLLTNLVLGLNRAALAEGLVFAQQLDLDPQQSLDVLRRSMAYSRIMDTKGEKMLSEDFAPQARLAQHLKDVRLMLAASDISLPLTETHRRLLEQAVTRGFGEADNSAIIKAIQSS